MEKTAVTVKIFNDEYTLKTDLPRTDVMTRPSIGLQCREKR